ncbi:MAG: DUF4912 domain-containing protein [Cyanobacteria bacterium P01_H01_bin.21]
MSLVKLITSLMAAAAVSQIVYETLSHHTALAQSSRENSETLVSESAGFESDSANTSTAGPARFPFWLLSLLAIPLLGAVLWWLLKSNGVLTAATGVTADATDPAQARIVLTLRDSQNAYAYWEIPGKHLAEVKRQGGETMMIRIYDVTGRNKNASLSAPAAEFPCLESNPDLHLPIAVDDRSYCAEVGYLTADSHWLPIAKSASVRVPIRSAMAGVNKQASKASLAGASLTKASPKSVDTSGAPQTFTIHSHAVMFDQDQLRHIEQDIATTHELTPGVYTLHLRDGVFNYNADDNHPGEPFVLLWIRGGAVVNQKTGVPVSSTWTTLNGYEDTLRLDVREPATLCAFFVDTYPDDNAGEVTISVIKH